MTDGSTQPTQLTVCGIMDMFLPSPSDLLVNLNEARGLVHQLLEELPNMFKDTNETFSAVGAAMQAAYKLASPTGGRVTIFQHTLPTLTTVYCSFQNQNCLIKLLEYILFSNTLETHQTKQSYWAFYQS